jgi:Uma2 family endonuclease
VVEKRTPAMVTIVAPKFTYKDLQEMPDDGKRYQLIDGEAYVTPSPGRAHQRTVLRLGALLRERAEKPGLGEVYIAPFDVIFDEFNALQPDLLFVRKERVSIVTDANVRGAPDLVIEVLSPSNRSFDRERKLQVYARAGVMEVWYLEPAERTAEILNAGPDGRYRLTARLAENAAIVSKVLPGLTLTLDEVFSG